MSFALALVLSAWPVTQAEKKGEAYVYDARVVESAPCAGKEALELRLYARGAELRLGLKNCGAKALKVLHDSQLGPSKLELSPPSKSVADSRAAAKFDPTVRPGSFTTLQPGEERVVSDAKLAAGSLRWGPFEYEGVPAKATVKAVLVAGGLKGVDAVTGTFTSNDVTLP